MLVNSVKFSLLIFIKVHLIRTETKKQRYRLFLYSNIMDSLKKKKMFTIRL